LAARERQGIPIEAFGVRRYTGSILKSDTSGLSRFHLKLGWAWIFLFSLVGLVLEGLHGLKAGVYLDVGNEPRRLMWTLAHTHGTLIGLIHIAFSTTLSQGIALTPKTMSRLVTLASRCLVASGVLLPAGFFLGGVVIHGGDPGIFVLLVPVGAIALIVASALVVKLLRQDSRLS
jgi:hypothetical protein